MANTATKFQQLACESLVNAVIAVTGDLPFYLASEQNFLLQPALWKTALEGVRLERIIYGSMERAGTVLRRQHRELVVSKRTIEKARGVELVRIKRQEANQTLCFCSRPFVLCGLPVRRPPQNQLLYQRRNGQFVLQITGHPDYGLPFGQERVSRA